MTSICIFGSFARASTDHLSDRDVLMIARRPDRVAELRRKWERDGWNVTSFSARHFKKMAKANSVRLDAEVAISFERGAI
jgi:predicted nucleotidyltransferase